MPRPLFPPTPVSSTDIKARDGVQQLSSLHLSFELPPPALHNEAPSMAPALPPPGHCITSDSSRNPSTMYTPSMSMIPPANSKRRRLSRDVKQEPFALPPPPTRSRKIIQMRPRVYDKSGTPTVTAATADQDAKGPASATNMVSGVASTTDKSVKKKTANGTSAAGRKIARKTAHSLIERRRRSKMNEEFGVLKNMIPACTGEMHKLAILQASIEYIRYLEECVAKLKVQHGQNQNHCESGTRHQLPSIRAFHPTLHDDVEMSDSDTASPMVVDKMDQQRQPVSSVSPPHQGQSPSSAGLSTTFKHYTFSATDTTWPAFASQQYSGPQKRRSLATVESKGTSSILGPYGEADQEASTAVMMLNHQRTNSSGGRGLSVRELLTT